MWYLPTNFKIKLRLTPQGSGWPLPLRPHHWRAQTSTLPGACLPCERPNPRIFRYLKWQGTRHQPKIALIVSVKRPIYSCSNSEIWSRMLLSNCLSIKLEASSKRPLSHSISMVIQTQVIFQSTQLLFITNKLVFSKYFSFSAINPCFLQSKPILRSLLSKIFIALQSCSMI